MFLLAYDLFCVFLCILILGLIVLYVFIQELLNGNTLNMVIYHSFITFGLQVYF